MFFLRFKSAKVGLANYVRADTTVDQIDIYQVMRAAGQVESLLGLAAHARFEDR